MSFVTDHPGIGIILLGAALCVLASGASPLGFSMFGEAIEAGPSGPLSGPLWVLGLVLIFIGAAIETKSSGVLSA